MIHEDTINNKLLVLFILDRLEMPVNEEILLQMCAVDNNWIPYFYCKQVVAELTSANFISRRLDEKNTKNYILTINEDGKICLGHFFKDIPLSVREDVSKYIKSTRLEYRKKQEFFSKYSRESDGSYKVSCQILKVNTPIFELNFNVATHKKALSICNGWTEKAPDVYKSFIDILLD